MFLQQGAILSLDYKLQPMLSFFFSPQNVYVMIKRLAEAIIISVICNLIIITIVNVNIKKSNNLLHQVLKNPLKNSASSKVHFDNLVLLQTCGQYVSHSDKILMTNGKFGILTALASCSSLYLSPLVIGMGLHVHRDKYLMLTDNPTISTAFTLGPVKSKDNKTVSYGDAIVLFHEDYQVNAKDPVSSLCSKGSTFILEPPAKELEGRQLCFGEPFFLSNLGYKRVNHFDQNFYVGPVAHRTLFYLQPAYAPLLKGLAPHEFYNYGNLKKATKNLRIMTYNIWMLPDFLTRLSDVSHSKKERAWPIVQNMLASSPDILVLTEAFDNPTREFIIRNLRPYGYYYETPCLGVSGKYGAINGGIIILSRYQIIDSQQKVFKESCEDDYLANKGILYIKILSNKRFIHIFGVHMQAWNTEECRNVRQAQLQELKEMCDRIKQNASASDIVFIVGDLNINRYDNLATNEYDMMLSYLNVDDLLHSTVQATINPFENELANGQTLSNSGHPEIVDYILHDRQMGKCTFKGGGVLPVKTKYPYRYRNELLHDLSDHYPIYVDVEIS
jgi:endonuclease/exonuclease/phosphatase family metal-dependent hydrolase